jgi:hypothetical protein
MLPITAEEPLLWMPRGRAEADLQNKDGRTALKYARMLHQDNALLLKAGARE